MGCCKKNKTKNDKTKKIKTNKVEKKKNLITIEKENKTAEEKNTPNLIVQNQPLKTENLIQQQPVTRKTSPVKYQLESPVLDDDISPTDNISSIKTFDDLQTSVEHNLKPISIVLFHGRYCPYSKRTIPGLRQWTQLNKDRIYLYEADVEQALQLAEYYHVQTIPTIMAFEENNLLVPIWQRTANNVLSSIEEFEPMEHTPDMPTDHKQFEELFRGKLDQSNNIFIVLDSSVKGPNRLLKMVKTPNENHQEQYLIILDNNQTATNSSKLLLAITNEQSHDEFLKTMNQLHSTKSIASSQQSSYIWNRSNPNIENNSEKSQLEMEYNGRMISQSTLNTTSNDNQLKKNRTWDEHLDDSINTNQLSSDEYQQHIHLPKCNEIYYEKQYDDTDEFHPSSSSFDRFSTLTTQYIRDTNNLPVNQQEEMCILYIGPNRCRGFEDNQPVENNSSKLSLLTLKSHSLSE